MSVTTPPDGAPPQAPAARRWRRRLDGRWLFTAFVAITALTWAVGLVGEHYVPVRDIAFGDGFPGDPARWKPQGDPRNVAIDAAAVTVGRTVDERSYALRLVRFPDAADPTVERLLRVDAVVETLEPPSRTFSEPARVMLFLLDDVDAEPVRYRTVLELDGARPSVAKRDVIGLEPRVRAAFLVLMNDGSDGTFRLSDAHLELIEPAPGWRARAAAMAIAWIGFGIAAVAWSARRLGGRLAIALLVPMAAIVVGVMLPEHLRLPYFGDWIERFVAWLRRSQSDGAPSVFKLGHFAFFLLAGIAAFSLRGRLGISRAATFACFVVFAFATEGLQLYLHDRTTRLSDLGIDLAGVLLGALTVELARRWRYR